MAVQQPIQNEDLDCMFGAMCQFSRERLGGANVPEQMARRDMRLNHFTPLDRGGIRPSRNFGRCRQREPNGGFCSGTIAGHDQGLNLRPGHQKLLAAHNRQFTAKIR